MVRALVNRVVAPACLVAILAGGLAGCRNTPGPDVYAGRTSMTVPRYDEAFEHAKDVLRDLGFELDRIDARAGIITTRPRTGAGLATPWVHTEEPVNDLAHRNRRVARFVFAPADAPAAQDLRAFAGAIDVECRIEVERVYVPGRRPSPTSVRLGGTWRDRDLPGERVRFAQTVENDDELAAEAIDRLGARLGTPTASE